MSVDGQAVRLRDETDEPGWEVDPDDEWGVAVVATVGRQLRLRREAVGMRVADFAVAVGYGEDMVYKIEGGKRIPRPEYLDRADEILGAGGLLSAMNEDVKKVQYPKKVREIAELEARAVEIELYDPLSIHGLLQTPEYATGTVRMRRPAYTDDVVARGCRRSRRTQVGVRSGPDARTGLHPGGVDTAAPARRAHGIAPPARTPAGGGSCAMSSFR